MGVLFISGTNGSVSLSGSSNWSGGLELEAGTLTVANQYALGSGTVHSNTDQLLVYTSIHLNNPAGMTIPNSFYLSGNGNAGGDTSGSLYGSGPGILQNDAGNNVITGAVDPVSNSGNLTVKVNAGSLDIQGPVQLTSIYSSRYVFLGGVSSGTIDGVISDAYPTNSLSLTKIDSGSWTLTNTGNNYAGTLMIGNGTLAVYSLGNSGVGSNGTGLITLGSTASTTAAPATLQFLGSGGTTSRTIGLSGKAAIDASGTAQLVLNGSVTGAYNLTLTGSGSGYAGGSIQTGTGSLTKNGLGTWTLAASNNYSGGTTLNAGTLVVTGTGASGSGSVTLNGGLLASGPGNVALNGSIVNGSGAYQIAPGGIGQIGTLSIGGSVGLSSNATLDFDLNGNNADSLNIGGVLSLISGTANLAFNPVARPDCQFLYPGHVHQQHVDPGRLQLHAAHRLHLGGQRDRPDAVRDPSDFGDLARVAQP